MFVIAASRTLLAGPSDVTHDQRAKRNVGRLQKIERPGSHLLKNYRDPLSRRKPPRWS